MEEFPAAERRQCNCKIEIHLLAPNPRPELSIYVFTHSANIIVFGI